MTMWDEGGGMTYMFSLFLSEISQGTPGLGPWKQKGSEGEMEG